MKNKNNDILLFGASVISFLVFALSFILMSADGTVNGVGPSLQTVVAGVTFWISAISCAVTQVILVRMGKKWCRENSVDKKFLQALPGIISFFKNPYATVFDTMAALSLGGFTAAMVMTDGSGYVCYVILSIFVFTFSMHCVLNGKTYYILFNRKKLLQLSRKEKTESVNERSRKNG